MSSKIKELFINNEKSKHLMINKNDIMFIKDIYKRNMIKNQVIFDINNIITIFIDLSMINIIIKILIISNLIRNLKASIHLTYQKVLLYYISHFHFNHFKYDFKFNLYIILFTFYDKKIK